MAGIAVRAAPPGSSHIKLKFEDEETLPNNILREIGLKIRDGENGPMYRSYDDASRSIVDLVGRNGYAIDPQTLEIQFEKSAWDGPFGAYYERPKGNRPSFTVNVDHRKRHPTLSARQYTAGLGSGQAAMPARISAAVEFRGVLYVAIAGTRVYSLGSWSGSGEGTAFFTLVFTHSNGSAVLRDLVVYDDVLYAAAGETAVYAYSTDGAVWVESNRGNPDDKAEQFMVLNDVLHKTRMPNLHYQTTSGINGGAAWSPADAIGETGDASTGSFEMVGLSNNAVFGKEEGIFNLDGQGNTTDLLPGLQKKRDRGNGWHSYVWSGDKMLYPTHYGLLYMIQGGRFYHVAPALSQERALEVGTIGRFIGRVRAMVDDTQYLYAEIQKPADNTHRIVCLEQVGDELVWRSLLDLSTTTSDELWITSQSTSGPILWASTATDLSFKASYWTLPAGPDPLQDTRMRYAASGSLYEPWNDLGCPNTPKLWFEVTITAAANGTGGSITMVLEADDGTTYSRTLSVTTTPTPQVILIPKQFIQRRTRFRWDFATTTAATTPILLDYTIRAQPNPEPIRIFEFTIDAPASESAFPGLTQRQIRAFLDHMRKAVYPLHLYTIFYPNIVDNTGLESIEEVWSVMPFPPPPMEQAVRHDSTNNMQRWDTAWTITLIERKTRQFELLEDGNVVLPPSEDLGGPVSLELITLAIKSNVLYPAYTLNRTAGTVNWIPISRTGLPVAAVGYHILDPWDVTNKMYIILRPSVGNGVEIWYNSSYRTVGSTWTQVFGLAQFNTATGRSETSILHVGEAFQQHSLWASIASNGYYAFVVRAQSDSVKFVFHTHNSFSTLTATSQNPTIGTEAGDLKLGMWDEALITIGRYNPIGQGYDFGLSVNGGHTFTYPVFTTHSVGNFTVVWLLPYQGNQAYAEMLAIGSGGAPNAFIYRSATGWQAGDVADWVLWGTVTGMGAVDIAVGSGFRLDPVGGQVFVVARASLAQYSLNRGKNWQAAAISLPSSGGTWDIALWPGGGLESAMIQTGTAGGANFVIYTNDFVTIPDLTGDYGTTVIAVDTGLVGQSISFGVKAPA